MYFLTPDCRVSSPDSKWYAMTQKKMQNYSYHYYSYTILRNQAAQVGVLSKIGKKKHLPHESAADKSD